LGAERTSCMKLLLGYICGTKTWFLLVSFTSVGPTHP
jgi:hypothetical protein